GRLVLRLLDIFAQICTERGDDPDGRNDAGSGGVGSVGDNRMNGSVADVRSRYTTTGSASVLNGYKLTPSVAVVDGHGAIHAAVELWCAQADPSIRFVGNFYSADQFLDEHPVAGTSSVGAVVLELETPCHRVDFSALDRIVARRHRVIVY